MGHVTAGDIYASQAGSHQGAPPILADSVLFRIDCWNGTSLIVPFTFVRIRSWWKCRLVELGQGNNSQPRRFTSTGNRAPDIDQVCGR
jgi:hypothetical protein